MKVFKEVKQFTPRMRKLAFALLVICILVLLLVSFIWIYPERDTRTWPSAYRSCHIWSKREEQQKACEEESCHYTYRAAFEVSSLLIFTICDEWRLFRVDFFA